MKERSYHDLLNKSFFTVQFSAWSAQVWAKRSEEECLILFLCEPEKVHWYNSRFLARMTKVDCWANVQAQGEGVISKQHIFSCKRKSLVKPRISILCLACRETCFSPSHCHWLFYGYGHMTRHIWSLAKSGNKIKGLWGSFRGDVWVFYRNPDAIFPVAKEQTQLWWYPPLALPSVPVTAEKVFPPCSERLAIFCFVPSTFRCIAL